MLYFFIFFSFLYKGVEPNQVIFFDDSEPNISHACDMGVNAHVTAPFLRIHEKHIAEHLGLESVV